MADCLHGCGNSAPAGGIGQYCDPCHDDSCLVAGPDGDGVCGFTVHELTCHCCESNVRVGKLTELCSVCFDALTIPMDGTDNLVKCSRHGYRFDPAHNR